MRLLDLYPTFNPLKAARVRGTLSRAHLRERAAELGLMSMYQGLFRSPCSCRAQVAADFLGALGRHQERGYLFRDYTPLEAAALGQLLLKTCRELEEAWLDQLWRILPRHRSWMATHRRMWMRRGVTVGDAIRAIENTGHWYLAVARQGSGVRASF